jgi:hypothetical protein
VDEVLHRRMSDEDRWSNVEGQLEAESRTNPIDRIEGRVGAARFDASQVRGRDGGGCRDRFEGEAQPSAHVLTGSAECHADGFWIRHAVQ